LTGQGYEYQRVAANGSKLRFKGEKYQRTGTPLGRLWAQKLAIDVDWPAAGLRATKPKVATMEPAVDFSFF